MTPKSNTRGIGSLGSVARAADRIVMSARGRVCAESECFTVLSAYNSAVVCWVHEVPRNYRPKPSRR